MTLFFTSSSQNKPVNLSVDEIDSGEIHYVHGWAKKWAEGCPKDQLTMDRCFQLIQEQLGWQPNISLTDNMACTYVWILEQYKAVASARS